MQRLSDLSVVGRVLAVMQIGYRFSVVVPLLAAPFLAEIFCVQAVLVAAGIFCTLVAIALLIGILSTLNDATRDRDVAQPRINS